MRTLLIGLAATALVASSPASAQWYGPGPSYGPAYGYGYDGGRPYRSYDAGPGYGYGGDGYVEQEPSSGPIYEGRSVSPDPGGPEGGAEWCASHYRSYNPQSGMYLGFDGMRHPCP
jgi:hypothetical protein